MTRAGTARHVRALLESLEQTPGIDLRRFAFGRPSRALVPARDVAWYLGVLPWLARRAKVDVLHCPTFRAPLRSPVPMVVTVHDLAVLRHPETFNAWTRRYSRLALPHVVRSARRIIAVSEFTRRELIDLLGVPPERIQVIPNAISEPFSAEGPAADGDYVLTVSTLEPRKNLQRLLEGFRRAKLDGLELRVVGARGWGDVRVPESANIRWLGEIPDAELARQYRGASAVMYLSLYEGFGLPVLEAMAAGTPVLTSRGGALEEVAGGAAVLADPLDAQEIAAGLAEALRRREELTRLGRERAAGFSWRRAAEATVRVYRDAAGVA